MILEKKKQSLSILSNQIVSSSVIFQEFLSIRLTPKFSNINITNVAQVNPSVGNLGSTIYFPFLSSKTPFPE